MEPGMLESNYEVKLPNTSTPLLRVKTRSDVFSPTDTSLLLIEACRTLIKEPGKTLDLGCGCGVTGLALANLGLCSKPLYSSDVSAAAVGLTLENAKTRGIECIGRIGSLFEPWSDETFDCIVDDVSGISGDIAQISPWFPSGVPCNAGRDGIRWIVSILEQAPRYLRPHGILVFPVLSLSAEEKIIRAAHKNFMSVELLVERQWILPKSISDRAALVSKLIEEGVINCVKKFGKYIWWTKVFAARN
jgi:SAM-dependent methyltransferase